MRNTFIGRWPPQPGRLIASIEDPGCIASRWVAASVGPHRPVSICREEGYLIEKRRKLGKAGEEPP